MKTKNNNHKGYFIIIGMLLLAAILFFASCRSVKDTTTTNETKKVTDTSVSAGQSLKTVSTFDSIEWIKSHGTYKTIKVPVYIHDTITHKDTVVYVKTTEGTYNKDKKTSVKKTAISEWNIWNRYNVYTNYDVTKTVNVTKKTAFSWWPYLIVFILGMVAMFYLSKLISPAKIITTAEDEYKKIKSDLLKK